MFPISCFICSPTRSFHAVKGEGRAEGRAEGEEEAAPSPTPCSASPTSPFGSGLFSAHREGLLGPTAQIWRWSSSNWLFFFVLINISTAAAARANLPEPLCVWLTLVFPLPITSAAVFSLKLPLLGFAQHSERQSCFLLPF